MAGMLDDMKGKFDDKMGGMDDAMKERLHMLENKQQSEGLDDSERAELDQMHSRMNQGSNSRPDEMGQQ